jgi:uncharacterized NAD(P)/FAD-binding protein YdhS
MQQSSHHAATPGEDIALPRTALSLRALTRLVREGARKNLMRGADWRGIINSLRGRAPDLWAQLPEADRNRFTRHLQPYWDIHRHRLPPAISELIADARSRCVLRVRPGRIRSLHAVGDQIKVMWQSRGQSASNAPPNTLIADAVINATGPNYCLRSTRNPLLRALHDDGLITADSASLGIRTDASGAVIGANDQPHPHLFYLGPMLRTSYWETTAVAELRGHAERLANTLLSKQRLWNAL